MSASRPIAVLRPEPGGSATAARVEALGLSTIRLPLFRVVPIAWTPPDPDRFDALLLTSANAVRNAGPDLQRLAGSPVLAVGSATAAAARAAGLDVRMIGTGGVADLLAAAARAGFSRVFHLSGRDTVGSDADVADRAVVYASEPVPLAPERVATLAGSVALLHSPRAGARLAAAVDDAGVPRVVLRLAALSAAVAGAVGGGWDRVAVAARPDDDALLAAARASAADD